MTLTAYVYPKLQTAKDLVRQTLKSPVPEHPSIDNTLKGPKNCCNLQDSTFMSYKISLLMISKILGLFLNKLTAND